MTTPKILIDRERAKELADRILTLETGLAHNATVADPLEATDLLSEVRAILTDRTSETTGVRTYWRTGDDGEPELINEPIALAGGGGG